jgi:coenzyme F420-0:L-glutamate ligase/coenzyme F420-1:gamma-L-glutamate ligase
MNLTLTTIDNLPLINPGDNLGEIIADGMQKQGISPQDGDVLVLAQKIVSKAEGRLVNMTNVTPTDEAKKYAEITGKDPRFVELVLRESQSVVRTAFNTLIVEHKLGFISANAGIDHSNVHGDWGKDSDWVLLLPENPDRSAEQIREYLQEKFHCPLGVLIIDSHGRAWRNGTVGVTIGLAGMPGMVDLRGTSDIFGFHLKITQVAAADELAAGASLVMGQASEKKPVVFARGFPYALREGNLQELIRPKEQDLFR